MNAKLTAWQKYVQALPNNANVDVTEATSAITAADNALLRASWPANVVPDIKSMTVVDAALIADLEQVNNQTALSEGGYMNQLQADESKASAAANIVRADLGLPPPSTG
jgi:hypothetical protein